MRKEEGSTRTYIDLRMPQDQKPDVLQPLADSVLAKLNTSASAIPGPEQPQKGRRGRRVSGKERVGKGPNTPGRRSSIYRGVTRHRWTGRYEAHLWDKTCWNQTQNKKGRQVYLGAYDDEEVAARAYDLAALKYWGPGTIINFPLTDYTKELEDMRDVSKEEYLASLRRKSSGFSRGVSKYRGVARHHHNGRWEARIGRIFGNKYLYLGTYSTQEEAAAAYDMAAIEYRGLNAVTNFDLSRYIRWLRPAAGQAEDALPPIDPNGMIRPPQTQDKFVPRVSPTVPVQDHMDQGAMWGVSQQRDEVYNQLVNTSSENKNASGSAVGLLLQSGIFKQMLDRAKTNGVVQLAEQTLEEKPQEQRPCNIGQSHCHIDQIAGSGQIMDTMTLDVKQEILSFQEEVRHVFDHSEMSIDLDQPEDLAFGTTSALDRMFFQSDMTFPFLPINPCPAELIDQGATLLESTISPFNSLSLPYAISTCS